jgi:hypothetical protein
MMIKKKSSKSIMPIIKGSESENIILHPVFIMEQAFSKVSAVGSSTAMIGIRNRNEIALANLGDSGFMIVRFKNGEAFTYARSKD